MIFMHKLNWSVIFVFMLFYLLNFTERKQQQQQKELLIKDEFFTKSYSKGPIFVIIWFWKYLTTGKNIRQISWEWSERVIRQDSNKNKQSKLCLAMQWVDKTFTHIINLIVKFFKTLKFYEILQGTYEITVKGMENLSIFLSFHYNLALTLQHFNIVFLKNFIIRQNKDFRFWYSTFKTLIIFFMVYLWHKWSVIYIIFCSKLKFL